MIAQSIIEELPVFLRGFTAYHFRVRFVPKTEILFKSKWYFLPRFALGNALKNSGKFSHLYSILFKPQEEEGDLSSSSRLIIRADKPNRRGLAVREPLDLYITIVAKEVDLVEDFLKFLPEWQEYNFFQEYSLLYHSFQLFNPAVNKYETELQTRDARLDIHFFQKHAPRWSEFLSIRFLTPTTLKVDGVLTDTIPFFRLMNRFSRRLYDLYNQYLSSSDQASPSPYIFAERDDLWLSQVSIPRVPTIKEKRQYDMAGILGQLHYRTPYDPIVAIILSAIHWVHIGNHTITGNGQIIATETNTSLYSAWISSLEENVADVPIKGAEYNNLIESLRSYSYIPDSYRSIRLPKSEGSFRELRVPSTLDMYLQKTLVQTLYPVLDKIALPQSCAYRRGKGAFDAIKKVDDWRKKLGENYYIIRCDIDDFFDTIPVGQLLERLQKVIQDPLVLWIIGLWLNSGFVDKKARFHLNTQGLPQGSPLSPILANFYLSDTDQYIAQNITEYFIRYADDILLLVPNNIEPLVVLQSLSDHLKMQKQLSLNRDFIVTTLESEFSFLGISFCSKGRKEMSRSKKEKLEQKITIALYQDSVKFSALEKTIDGIKRYYQKLVSEADLVFVDEKAADIYATFLSTLENQTERKNATDRFLQIGFLSLDKGKALLKSAISKTAQITQIAPKFNNEKTVLKKQFKKYLQEQEDVVDLVVSEPGSFIGISRNYIVVRKSGQVICKQPISQIEQISIISKGVSFSSNVTNYCNKKNIRIVYYNAIGEAYASVNSINPILPSIMKAQIGLQEERIRIFITELVRNKIKNQAKLIKYYYKYFRKEEALRGLLRQTIEELDAIEKMSFSGETIEVFRQNAMLHEAKAARVYWVAFALLTRRAGYDFEKRVHQGASDLVNQMLNYGYAILQSYVARTIDLWQLSPNVGILHSTQDNSPVLCFDLMEQYRAFVVDRSVLALLSKGEEVGQDKSGLLDMATRKRIISKIKERWFAMEYFRSGEKVLSDIMRLQTKDVRDFCLGKIDKVKFYTPKW